MPNKDPPNPKDHPDFQLPWLRTLLSDPNTTIQGEASNLTAKNNNRLFGSTLSQASTNAVRALLYLTRQIPSPTNATRTEDIYIASLGSGIDGAAGRAHGGFNSLLLDHVTGSAANREFGGTTPPPATAYLNVQYRAPVNTPCVVMARAWATKVEGRKVFLRGVLEDGRGHVYAEGEALYIAPRKGAL